MGDVGFVLAGDVDSAIGDARASKGVGSASAGGTIFGAAEISSAKADPTFEVDMGLFKSKEERRIEREMKIRQGMKAIERSIRQQEKFSDDFIKNAQHARKIGDKQQYAFIRGALKKTAAVKKMLERQLLSIKNAMLIQQQAAASRQFAESMTLMAKEIGQTFKEMDLTKTQADWERAVTQAGTIEEKMDVFLDSMEQSAISGGVSSGREELVSDEEIDRMIQADVLAQEKGEIGKLDSLESEIAK